MTFVDQAECEHCGHQFRSGLAEDATPEPDSLHRTQQFTLPPIAPRAPASAPPAIPPVPAARRGRPALGIGAALAVLAALAVFAFARSHVLRPAALSAPSPVGAWEGTLPGAASGGIRLRLVFQEDGTGLFSWQEGASGASRPLSGQSPLRWRRDPSGLLALSLTPPSAPDAVSDMMVPLFNGRAWPWRVDRARGRLVLGGLVFAGA